MGVVQFPGDTHVSYSYVLAGYNILLRTPTDGATRGKVDMNKVIPHIMRHI